MPHSSRGGVLNQKMWGAGLVWLSGDFYKDGRKRRGSSHLPRASPRSGDTGNDLETEFAGGKSLHHPSDPAHSNTTLDIPAFLPLPHASLQASSPWTRRSRGAAP